MSYRDPHQYVDTTTSQHFQNLQTTIAGAFGGVAKSYAQRQKELKAENEKKEAQTKLIKKGIAKEASLLQRTLYATDNKYPEVDFGELYNPLIKEFEDLSLAIENGTSEDPTADRKRADQIYASVSGITDTLTDLVSFTEDYDIKFDNVDKPGGIYSGMNPDVTLALNIMMQKLPGKRVPRFIDNDMSKFVWDIYDDQGNLVESFSKHRLDQISKGIDEMVTTIPDNTKDFDQIKEANPNIFVRKKNNKGEFLPTNEINQKFLKKGTEKKISVDCPENSDARKKCWAMSQDVDKYGEKGIIWDQTFNTTMDAQIAQTLGTGATDNSAIALQNTQFKKVTYTIEDFTNNPTFKEKYKDLKYEELPEEIRTAIDGDGHVFDFDEPLTEAEKDIFNVAYKKDFLEKNVQKHMIGPSREEIETEETTTTIQNRIDLEKRDEKIRVAGFGKTSKKLIDLTIPKFTAGGTKEQRAFTSAIQSIPGVSIDAKNDVFKDGDAIAYIIKGPGVSAEGMKINNKMDNIQLDEIILRVSGANEEEIEEFIKKKYPGQSNDGGIVFDGTN